MVYSETNQYKGIIASGIAVANYLVNLSNLGITLKNDTKDISMNRDIIKAADLLKKTLYECDIDIDIQTEFNDTNKIIDFVKTGSFIKRISNIILRKYGGREENLFSFAYTVSMVHLYKDYREMESATGPAKQQAFEIGRLVGLPDEIIDKCIKNGLPELMDYIEKTQPSKRKIFLVHGRDSGTKEMVARYLSKLQLDPVILHEQPNVGKTIIEKFELYSNVSYAVVLLTPDDIGRLNTVGEIERVRARQNVIFEFGYFIGKLGRHNVFGLKKGDIEVPSDYSGILYIDMDEGGAWRLLLAREMKAAGLEVDVNKAI